MPKPDHILVYDFAASLSDIPPESSLASQASAPDTPPTDEQAALTRQLGTQIAAELVQEIQDMGLPGTQMSVPTTAQINDMVIRGCLVSVDEGSATKRKTVGFGSGGSELTTFVEGYQMRANGLRNLGSGVVGDKDAKSPGRPWKRRDD